MQAAISEKKIDSLFLGSSLFSSLLDKPPIALKASSLFKVIFNHVATKTYTIVYMLDGSLQAHDL